MKKKKFILIIFGLIFTFLIFNNFNKDTKEQDQGVFDYQEF